MEPLSAAPDTSSFVPLAEHQSRTPASFYSGPPVLHYHGQNCKIVILERDLVATPPINSLHRGNTTANQSNDEENDDAEVSIEGVDAWVTSEKFFIYSRTAATGFSIPYPSISLHAIQRLRVPGSSDETQGLYMQIATPTAPSEDDEEQCITMTLVPPADAEHKEADADKAGDETEGTPTQQLYNAVSACSNLHPDPVEPGDEDDDDEMPQFFSADGSGNAFFQIGGERNANQNGDLPPPIDGSSGWITADNMHEFFDEEGNWIAEGEPPSFPSIPLGPGAGSTRAREENGHGEEDEDDDETKWRRTD